jgi:hypothetical protein
MEPRHLSERPQPKLSKRTELIDRRSNDRRKEHCEGYTYISTVGWICRRERKRRKLKPEVTFYE